MKILFTGSSSFTGYWFIKSLTEAGHEVIATFKGSLDKYEGIRKTRVAELIKMAPCVFDCSFGSDKFIKLIENQNEIHVLCHHYAHVINYGSMDFDVIAALQDNTLNIKNVLKILKEKDSNHLLLTGSIFEHNEGVGSDGLRAFSPYGLSKGLTSNFFKYYADYFGIKLGKFVIPNPFGPYEEPRFTTYLIKMWYERKTPQVATPDYVRDNIHVSLLSKAYTWFAENLVRTEFAKTFHPSGYAESQGAFAGRFAKEMSGRIGLPCSLDFAEQLDFPEPRVRINTDPVKSLFPDWSEKKTWDDLADYYVETLGQ